MRLSKEGKQLIADTFLAICVQGIYWKFGRIFEEIEDKLLRDNSMSYEIKGYFTETSHPYVINFSNQHFTEEEQNEI
jgi:hypothetical protein